MAANEMNQPASNGHDDAVTAVPETLFQALEAVAADHGGVYEEPTEYAGAVGRTMFDLPTSDDGSVTVLMPRDLIDALPSQALVRIKSVADRRSYLGAVVKGPFAEPDGLRADAPIVVSTTVRGALLLPKYHGRVQVALLGEELPDGSVVPPRRRPKPNSPVFPLPPEQAAEVLGISGDILLGVADSHEEIEVMVPSDSKAVFPRHLGILGTTGGGKSTTVSGLVSQLQAVGMAVVILDTEGEYTAINDPTSDPRMLAALKRRKLEPRGVANTRIWHLTGKDTRNPGHRSRTVFKLDFARLSPYAVAEILDLTPAQEARYFAAFDGCKQLLREFGIFPARGNRQDEERALELDESATGYPRMTLSLLIDVVEGFNHLVAKSPGDPALYNAVFKERLPQVKQRIGAVKTDSEPSWRALKAKLWSLHRLRIFDTRDVASLNYAQMLSAGHVSIVDLSDTDSPTVNNLVIADILRGIQEQQEQNYDVAIKSGKTPTPVMVFIEEAHEFLSAQRIKDMPVLFQQVARIARRGRKRWLGLAFSTQLPQHLPDEVLGLINNWILHKISDAGVVSRLRRNIGGIDESLWSRLPSLAPGQAVVSFTNLTRPLQVTIDPTPCRLLMVD
jgi:DNA helicase HerA-like ATPase